MGGREQLSLTFLIIISDSFDVDALNCVHHKFIVR